MDVDKGHRRFVLGGTASPYDQGEPDMGNMRTAGGKLLSDFVRRGPGIYGGPRPEDLISDYQSGYPSDYASYVKSNLDRNGLNEEALTTVSFIASLPELQKIDSMLN